MNESSSEEELNAKELLDKLAAMDENQIIDPNYVAVPENLEDDESEEKKNEKFDTPENANGE